MHLKQCSSEGQICTPAEAGAPVAKKPRDLAGDEAPDSRDLAGAPAEDLGFSTDRLKLRPKSKVL